MSHHLRFMVALAIIALSNPIHAFSINEFHEDFLSKEYCDTANTTALWDTVAGEIRLPAFEPGIVGNVAIEGRVNSCVADGNFLYVWNITYDALQVVDITEPTSPILASTTPLPSGGRAVLDGNYAYFAAGSDGFHVVDISSPLSPVLIATDNSVPATSLQVEGDLLYVAGIDGLVVFDIGNPVSAVQVGVLEPEGASPKGVYVDGDHAFLTTFYSGVDVVDIADPTAPIFPATKAVWSSTETSPT